MSSPILVVGVILAAQKEGQEVLLGGLSGGMGVAGADAEGIGIVTATAIGASGHGRKVTHPRNGVKPNLLGRSVYVQYLCLHRLGRGKAI